MIKNYISLRERFSALLNPLLNIDRICIFPAHFYLHPQVKFIKFLKSNSPEERNNTGDNIMNKIYKIVWSHTMQTWVVASELCRSKGKTKSKRVLSAAVLAAVSGIALVSSANAAVSQGSGAGISIRPNNKVSATTASEDGIAIGKNSISTDGSKHDQLGGISIGSGTSSNAGGIAIGHSANAPANGTISIGRGAHSQSAINQADQGGISLGDKSFSDTKGIAIGHTSSATAVGAIAIGFNAKTSPQNSGESSIAIGSGANASASGTIALGETSQASGRLGTAVGFGAQAKGNNSAAFGEGAIANKDYGVAVGKSANAHEQLGIAVGKNANATNWLSTAVGAKTQATGESSLAIGSGNLKGGNDLDKPEGAKATGNAATAVGASTEATKDNASAFGSDAKATGTSSVAVGNNSKAISENSIAIGNGAEIVSLTSGSQQNGNNGVAVGASSKATHWSAAVGPNANATGKVSAAFGDSALASAEGTVAAGSHATANVSGSVALGSGSTIVGEDGAVRKVLNKGDYIIRKSDDSTSPDYDKFANKDNTGFGDNESSDPNKVYAPVKLVDAPHALDVIKKTIRGSEGPVSIGSQGTTRQLINVAPGSADSDAVNVAQLKAVAGSIKHYNIESPDITVVPTDNPHEQKMEFNA